MGAKGSNGTNSYFHTAWADNEMGTEGFSLTESLGKKYIGTYADNTQAGSTDPTKYNWVELANAIDLHTACKMADGTFSKVKPGENLIIREGEIKNSWIHPSGVIISEPASANHSVMKDYIRVNSGEVYTCSRIKSAYDGGGYFRYRLLAEDESYISREGVVPLIANITIPDGASYIQVSYPDDSMAKLELGSTATIYTPAPSEDWANAIPKYVGTCTKDSDNPDDYTWTLNPEWVQMSSDKGLEDKLGNDQYMDDKGEIWTEIGNRVTAEEAQEIRDIAQGITDSYTAFVDEGGKYQQDLDALEARTVDLVNVLNDKLVAWDFIDTWMSAGEEGLSISSKSSTMKILISNDKITFSDGGQVVAYFTNQEFKINRGAIVDSLQVGSHKLKRIDDNHTIIQWVLG